MKNNILIILFATVTLGNCQSQAPQLGLQDTQFTPCPDTPNCVSSMASETDKTHYISPLDYLVPQPQAQQALLQYLTGQKDVTIKNSTPEYIHATFTTPWMRFVDDVEFYISPDQYLHLRSASRVGRSDMGTNRKRLEAIKEALRPVLNP